MKRDLLFVVSLAYLLLPAVIFAAGWLVWPVAALVVAAAVGGVAGIANADALAPSMAELPRTGTFDYAGQYLGRADGLFARTIMRGNPSAPEHRPGSGAR